MGLWSKSVPVRPEDMYPSTPTPAQQMQLLESARNAGARINEQALFEKMQNVYLGNTSTHHNTGMGIGQTATNPPLIFGSGNTSNIYNQQIQQARNEIEGREREMRRKKFIASPAMECSLSVAESLWIVKFGSGWVYKEDVTKVTQNEPDAMNWDALLSRLYRADRMEMAEVNSGPYPEQLYRIITETTE